MKNVSIDNFIKETFVLFSKFKVKDISRSSWDKFRKIYRKRTIKDIIRSKYFMGCYEPALIFYKKARKRGISARLIEMISKKSQLFIPADGGKEVENILSHCFVELKIGKKIIIIDPAKRKIIPRYSKNFLFFSEGPSKWKSFNDFYQAQKLFIIKKFKKTKGGIYKY